MRTTQGLPTNEVLRLRSGSVVNTGCRCGKIHGPPRARRSHDRFSLRVYTDLRPEDTLSELNSSYTQEPSCVCADAHRWFENLATRNASNLTHSNPTVAARWRYTYEMESPHCLHVPLRSTRASSPPVFAVLGSGQYRVGSPPIQCQDLSRPTGVFVLAVAAAFSDDPSSTFH